MLGISGDGDGDDLRGRRRSGRVPSSNCKFCLLRTCAKLSMLFSGMALKSQTKFVGPSLDDADKGGEGHWLCCPSRVTCFGDVGGTGSSS